MNGFLRGYLFFTSSPFNRFCSNLAEMCAMMMRNFCFFYFLILRMRMRTLTRLSSRVRNIAFIYSLMHAYYSVLYAQYNYPCRTYKCACIAHAWACVHLTFHLISMHRYTFLYATKCRTSVSNEIGFIIIFVSLLWKLSFIKSNIDHYYKKKTILYLIWSLSLFAKWWFSLYVCFFLK